MMRDRLLGSQGLEAEGLRARRMATVCLAANVFEAGERVTPLRRVRLAHCQFLLRSVKRDSQFFQGTVLQFRRCDDPAHLISSVCSETPTIRAFLAFPAPTIGTERPALGGGRSAKTGENEEKGQRMTVQNR